MYLPSGFLLLFQRDLANHFPRTSGGVSVESKEHKGVWLYWVMEWTQSKCDLTSKIFFPPEVSFDVV